MEKKIMNNCPVKFKKGNIPDIYFNQKQLSYGTKVEMEHTTNKCIAKQIAKSHLVESKNYYKILKKAGL